jgi:hypothetical protein
MSIDQYSLPFKHVRPLEYATTRPSIVSILKEGSETARVGLMSTPINEKILTNNRDTVELYPSVGWPTM